MVQKGVVAVLQNVNGQVAPLAKLVEAANIPIFAYNTADSSVLGYADGFSVSNPVAGLALFPAELAKKGGFTKAAIITVDVPAALGPIKALAPPTFAALGVPAVDIVGIAQGTADMGPQVQSELQKSPQLVHIVGNPAFCATVIKALRDASYSGTITMISNCLDASTIKSVGADLKGILVSYLASEDPANPDFQTFKAVVAKYDGGQINPSGTPVGSFVGIVAFNRVMATATGTADLTSDSVIATIKAAPALPYPTIAGVTFQCNGKAVPGLPIVCSAGFAYATLDDSGVPATFSAG